MTKKRKRVKYFQVAQGVWGMKNWFVNIYMIANRRGVANGWVLVDAGLKTSTKNIINMAESLFGAGTPAKGDNIDARSFRPYWFVAATIKILERTGLCT